MSGAIRPGKARGPKPRGIRPGKGPIAKGAHGQARGPKPKGIRPGKRPIAKRGPRSLILFYLCDK